MASRMKVVVGVFRIRPRAERAIEELRRLGLRDDQIGLRAGPFSLQPIAGLDRPVHLGRGAVDIHVPMMRVVDRQTGLSSLGHFQ